MPYAGTSPRLLNADLAVLETARTHIELLKASLQGLRTRAGHRQTQDKLDDFIAGLTDLCGDDISPAITAIEFDLGIVERRLEEAA